VTTSYLLRRSRARKAIPQDFLRRFVPGEFLDQFIEIADIPHYGLIDLFRADAADHFGHQ
jgi:hypothetical protein